MMRKGSVEFESRVLRVLPWVQSSDGACSLECDVRSCPFSMTPREERCLEAKAVLPLRARSIFHLRITVHGHTGGFGSGCREGHVTRMAFVLASVRVHSFVSIYSVIDVHIVFLPVTILLFSSLYHRPPLPFVVYRFFFKLNPGHRKFVAQAYNGVGVHELTRRQERPAKTRPGLIIICFITVTLFRIGHVVDINDVGGAFWYGRDDPETRWGDGTQDRRQRVCSWEVRIFHPFIWAARIRVQPRHEGGGRHLGWLDLGTIFLFISWRRRVPDLVGAKAIDRVLNTARGDIGTLTGVCLWSLFQPRLWARLVGTDTLQIFVYHGRAPWECESQPSKPSENGLYGPRDEDQQEVAEEVDVLE